MEYRNFDLEAFDYKATTGTETFRVRVINSPVGEQRQVEAEMASLPTELRGTLRRLDKRALKLPGLITLGEDLANALFPPRVRTFMERSRERLAEEEGLRVRLKLDTYALADLPWEYVYLPRPGTPPSQKGPDGFLVLDRGVSLVRYEVLGQAPGSLDPVGARPLRLVALLASPAVPGYPRLDLAAEQQGITQALSEVPDIRVESYPNATLDMLQDALVRATHIFHFAGHGKFEAEMGLTYGTAEGKGYLLFTAEDGREAPLSADKLALLLRGRGVRLAVLGACEAGRRDQVNAWSAVAPALTKAGIPAVVAMQYTIRDTNAIAFSRRFYRSLAAGQPIDAAMTDGRLAIFNRGDEKERDWGVPVLYLRADEGVLFPQVAMGASPLTGTGNGGPAQASTGHGKTVKLPRPPLEPDLVNVDKRNLREAMIGAFSKEELDAVCLEIQESLESRGVQLQVNLEMVGGSSKSAQILNLIQYLDRRGYLGYLVAAVRRERPGII